MEYQKRDEIPENYKWNLKTRYNNDEDWEEDFKKTSKLIKKLNKYTSHVLDDSKTLLSIFDEYYDTISKITKLFRSASLKHDEDLNIDKYSLMLNKAYTLYNDYLSNTSFIVPEILAGKSSKLDKFLKDKTLNKYHFYLENLIRNKEHILKGNEELLITKLSSNDNVFDKINSILTDSVLNYGIIKVNGEDVLITNSNYRHIMMNKDRKVRKECYELMTNKLKEFSSVLGESLIANMRQADTISNIRNFKDVLDMQLFSSNIPPKVVSNLYDVVSKRVDVFQKYLELVKTNLGLDDLKYYDLTTDILNDHLSFSIEEAEDLISEATKIYGEEYHNLILKAFNEHWIDYGSYKGKKSGAYSTCNYGNTPVVLTNFHGKFTDVSAVAHELGHAVNFYLSQKNNYAHEANNDIFVAEVASLTNEIILSNYIINHSKYKNLKLISIYNLIDIIQNNLFDAALEGELENIVYSKLQKHEEIGVNDLNQIILDIRKKYYGNVVILDDNLKYMWARRSHYFYPFYLFEYATGVSAAINVALKIIKDEDGMKEKYLKFLSKGETDYPVNLLKEIGIDMTKPEVINKAIDYFAYLLDEFIKESDV